MALGRAPWKRKRGKCSPMEVGCQTMIIGGRSSGRSSEKKRMPYPIRKKRPKKIPPCLDEPGEGRRLHRNSGRASE